MKKILILLLHFQILILNQIKKKSLQEELYHIESSGSDWEEINEGILDNRSENSIINNINLNNKKNLNFPINLFVYLKFI